MSLNIGPDHLIDLRKSGLSDKTIADAGIYSVTRKEAENLLGFSLHPSIQSALVFPYANDFYRLKVFPPYIDEQGHSVKYLQPKGSGVRLYIPPGVKQKLADISLPLYITEGEKKALKAAQEGFCVVGLGGIWNWKKKEEDEPIEEVENIPVLDREVSVVPDSDFIVNEHVKMATFKLGTWLEKFGAKTTVKCFQANETNGKVGLDDYLLSHTPKEFTGLKTVDLKHQIFKPFRQRRKASQGKSIGPEPEHIATFDSLIDLVQDEIGHPAFLLSKENALPEITSRFQKDEMPFVPPPSDQMTWLLPRAEEVIKHHETALERDNPATDETLFNDLVAFFKTVSELPTVRHYMLVAAFVIHTYLLENFQFSPIICFYAVPERGKSRTGKAITYLSYRGIHEESLRDAYLIRMADRFQVTVFFDVKDISKKAIAANSEDVLLQRFERGADVKRVMYPERGAFKDIVSYKIFGPTVIATNRTLNQILETRAIHITMPDTAQRFNNEITPKICLSLKERLVEFRLRHYGKTLPHADKPFNGRLGDIARPLLQVIRLVAPQQEPEFMKLFTEVEKDRKQDKSEGAVAKLIKVLDILEPQVDSDNLLAIDLIVSELNKSLPEKKKTDNQRVGYDLKALGIIKRKIRATSCMGAIFDRKQLDGLMDNYGLKNDPNDTPSLLSEELSTSPKASKAS